MNPLYYFPKRLTSRCLSLLFFRFYMCIPGPQSCSPTLLSHLLLTPPSHWPFFPARPHSIFLSPLWVWPTELTCSGLQETAYNENWTQVLGMYEQCLLLTTEPSLLHQVKCFKCHKDSGACRFCLHLHTGRLHILCQEPLTCFAHMVWMSSTFSCLPLSK